MKSPPAIFCDYQHIYLEWPTTKGGVPLIEKYPLTEGGMGKVLKRIPNIAPPGGTVSILDRHPSAQGKIARISKTGRRREAIFEPSPGLTELLRKRGMI